MDYPVRHLGAPGGSETDYRLSVTSVDKTPTPVDRTSTFDETSVGTAFIGSQSDQRVPQQETTPMRAEAFTNTPESTLESATVIWPREPSGVHNGNLGRLRGHQPETVLEAWHENAWRTAIWDWANSTGVDWGTITPRDRDYLVLFELVDSWRRGVTGGGRAVGPGESLDNFPVNTVLDNLIEDIVHWGRQLELNVTEFEKVSTSLTRLETAKYWAEAYEKAQSVTDSLWDDESQESDTDDGPVFLRNLVLSVKNTTLGQQLADEGLDAEEIVPLLPSREQIQHVINGEKAALTRRLNVFQEEITPSVQDAYELFLVHVNSLSVDEKEKAE